MSHSKLSEKEITDVITQFNTLNAKQAPITSFAPIVDCENLSISVENTDIEFKGITGFADHQIGKMMYFDQRFEVLEFTCNILEDHAIAKTLTHWHASYRDNLQPFSYKLIAEMKHSWRIFRKDSTKKAAILYQICHTYDYLPGHSPVEQEKELHLSLDQLCKKNP